MQIKKLFLFLLIILVLALISIYWPTLTGKSVSNNQEYPKEKVFVNRIIDGDTIVVSGNEIGENIHIRLLGINTLEKGMPYSNVATNYLKDEIEGKEIEIQRDITDIDKYKRNLRYIFYDNKLINVEILQQGLATSFMLNGLNYGKKLKNAEDFARNNNIGIWGESSIVCSQCIILEKLDPIKEYFILKNNCNFVCDLNGWFAKDDANHFFKIKNIAAFEEMQYNSKGEIWNDEGDRFFLRDKEGNLVIFYEYSNVR
jgi:micrococcal nuclease